jgi:HEPN domain-containing protein
MSLKDWSRNGWLVEHKTSPAEIAELLEITNRDLTDCRVEGLSADWRLNIAYNAALQAATVALAACGYRASRDAHHYRIIQSLVLTIAADPSLVRKLDAFRKKRNISGYDRVGMVSDQEAKEMISLAERIEEDVNGWLESCHPEFLQA